MKIERKKNAINGTIFGIALKILQIVFPFIIRTIFIRSIGIEYLGLNSLFTAILQVLNLAELGVSSALVFSMYRPIVDNDTYKLCQLMNLYKRYYRIIGLVILFAGLCIVPFLPKLISGDVPPDINLFVIYAMNLAATVLSYWLFAYRNSLFIAHQRNDITSLISIAVFICQYLLQAITLIYFKNYYLFLGITILSQIAINVITAILSKRYYPEYNPKGDISKSEKDEINRKVRDLFTAKVGSVVNNSVDSIVISSFLGLKVLAIYHNYYNIISALMAMFIIFFSACTAGIGNSLIVNDTAQNRKLLYNINHLVFMAINCCCACFICVCQPFVDLWVGKKYVLGFDYVLLFAVYLIAEIAPRTLLAFKDAGGIWRHDRFRPLIAASINLCLNLLLTRYIGLYGIILSTVFALSFIAYPWLILNIDKRLFRINIKKYIIRLFAYIFVICFSCTITYFITDVIIFQSLVLTIVVRLFIAGSISLLVFLLVFYRTSENLYVMEQIKHIKAKLYRRREVS